MRGYSRHGGRPKSPDRIAAARGSPDLAGALRTCGSGVVQRLCAVGEVTRYAYFPVNAIISLVTAIDGKPVLEVGMVGREGMAGAELVLGARAAPWHAVVQGPGS